jgi:alpha-galactosidase
VPALPFWPLGMPRWTASWVATGLRVPGRSYVLTWRRGPLSPGLSAVSDDPAETRMAIPHLRGQAATAEVLFPREAGATARWEQAGAELAVTLPQAPGACLIRLDARQRR